MKYFAIVCGLLTFTILSCAMEPAVVISGLGTSEAGNQQWKGLLSDGTDVVVEMHARSLRNGLNVYYSGKIGKKRLTNAQASAWSNRLAQGADYTVISAAIKQAMFGEQH